MSKPKRKLALSSTVKRSGKSALERLEEDASTLMFSIQDFANACAELERKGVPDAIQVGSFFAAALMEYKGYDKQYL